MKQFVKLCTIVALFSASLCSAGLSSIDQETIKQWAKKEFAAASKDAQEVIKAMYKKQVEINSQWFGMCQLGEGDSQKVKQTRAEIQKLVAQERQTATAVMRDHVLYAEVMQVNKLLDDIVRKSIYPLLEALEEADEDAAQQAYCKTFKEMLEYALFVSAVLAQN